MTIEHPSPDNPSPASQAADLFVRIAGALAGDAVEVVVPAPGEGPGNWAGAACAVREDGRTWLAYRVRRPLTEGRGIATVVACSDDGVRFGEVARIGRETFGAESFERPALVRLPDGRWRIYLSCATPGSKHWWIEAVTAGSPEALAGPDAERVVVLPGDDSVAVKDPVVVPRPRGGWDALVCCHPLTDPGDEDRMTTRRFTSDDGLTWTDEGELLGPAQGTWDARGARVTAVLGRDPWVLLYDGRPDAASNWYERTGLAVVGPGDDVRRVGPAGSPYGDGALRYVTLVRGPDGLRAYAERCRPDGAHDLVTALVPDPSA